MSKTRLVKTMAILVLVGGLFGGAFIFLMKFVDGPVQGKLDTSLRDAKASVAPTPVAPQALSGLYVSMLYPATFDQLGQIKTDSTALEQYNIGSQKDYRQSITVHVAPLPTGDMMEDSSYRLRAIDAATYKPVTITGTPDKSVLMAKIDKSEQTLFVVHQGKLLTVAVTSTSIKATAAQIMDVIKPSIRWAK